MGHQQVARSLLGLSRSFKRLDLSDPVTQCLAPRLSRSYATETELPTPSHVPRINPNVAEHLYTPPRVLTTIHSWPSLEPTRYSWYAGRHLDVPLRKDLLHRAVIYEGDATRQGTASTKWRDDVAGSGRKIRKQKGAGRARVGDKKSPTRRGGGVAHGPKFRDMSTDLQRKVYDRAWRTALSYRYRKGELLIVDGLMGLEDGQSARFLANWFEENNFGKGFGRSTLVTGRALTVNTNVKPWETPKSDPVGLLMAEAMDQLGVHGTLKDIEDVDVKDLLDTGRVIMEEKVLNALLLAHSSDLGPHYSLTYANQLAIEDKMQGFLHG